MIESDLIETSKEVTAALRSNHGVVALESTVIAHGLPRPQNLETARRLVAIVKQNEATPATIAIINGKICVGLDETQLRLVAESHDIKKISARDLPIAVACGWNGATTVASTSWIANRAGIQVFATGGIGGVHRGALPDLSADLPELARTPIVVVCSGAKIVLDLPATREWLETHGVVVVGFGCDEMPAFYSRQSGLPVDVRVDSTEEVKQIVEARKRLGMQQAILVTVPVPEEEEVPRTLLTKVLDEALREARDKGVGGRDLTPFLLSSMAEQSEGATLRANLALLENNAAIAARIAVALGTGS